MSWKGARTATAIVASLCLAAGDSLAAQDVGNRVRVTIGGDVLTGDVFETGENGFTLVLSQEELREVSNTDIEMLEVRTCCVDYAWALPTLAGMVVGGLGAAYASGDVVCTDTSFLGLFEDETCDIQGSAFWWGILGGSAVGFVVGKVVFREAWEIIPVADRRGPTLGPLIDFRSGVHSSPTMILGARIRF